MVLLVSSGCWQVSSYICQLVEPSCVPMRTCDDCPTWSIVFPMTKFKVWCWTSCSCKPGVGCLHEWVLLGLNIAWICLGILSLAYSCDLVIRAGAYYLVITGRKEVGEHHGSLVFQVTAMKFLSCNQNLQEASADEVCSQLVLQDDLHVTWVQSVQQVFELVF